MGGSLNVFVVILLTLSQGESFELENVSVEEPQNSLKEFIFEHHKETRGLMKAEIEKYFNRLSDSLNAKLTEMEKSFEKRLSSTDSKVEMMERSVNNLAPTFDLKLSESEEKVLSGLEDQGKSILKIHQELTKVSGCQSVTNLTASTSTPTRVEVEKLSVDSGTIEFDGGMNSHLKRKIWVLMSEGKKYYPPGASFMLTENKLGENAHLSVWSDYGGLLHVWNGSQTNWSIEKKTTTNNNLILVTLTVTLSAATTPPPSFKLAYNLTRSAATNLLSGEVISTEGLQSVSFPPQNAQDVPSSSSFRAVLAPQNGLPFRLTLKFLDLPGTPPKCSENGSLHVFFLEENSMGVDYKHVDTASIGKCGIPGNTFELHGTSTAAILRFYSGSGGGRGFRVEMDST